MIGTSLLLAAARSTLLSGLLAFWKLDGNANDATGTFNGTPTGVSWASGKVGQAASFAGGGAITTAITSALLNFSVSLWFNPGATVYAARLVDKSFSGGFWIGRDATVGGTAPERWGGGILNVSPPYGIYVNALNGVWNHMVFQREGTAHRIYINGALGASATVSGAPTDATAIMLGNAAGGFPYAGLLDEVGIWNRAISAAEIAQLYNGGAGLTHPF